MPWYLGRPGAILQLPAPARGTQVPFASPGATHQLLSGGQVQDKFPAKRSWQFSWQALTRDQAGVLDGFVYGTVGPGPYVLLDPEQRNLLTPNVSAGGDVTGDSTGFVFPSHVTGGASGDVSLTPGGRYSILMAEDTSVVAFQDVLIAAAYIPVIAGLSYALSVQLRLNSNCPTHYAEIQWFGATFTQLAGGPGISYSDGNTITGGSGGGQSSVVATAPTGAVYAQVRVKVSTANTAGVTVFSYADAWQFEQSSVVDAWVPGVGVPYVSVSPGGGRTRQQTNQNDYGLTLVEL